MTFCLFAYGMTIQAQSTIPSLSKNASAGGGSTSYVIGQVFYTTISSLNHSITQGVQMPCEISVITGIEKDGDISLNIIVFSNPASAIICLKTNNYETYNLQYHLYDFNGRLLLTGRVDDYKTSIAIGHCKLSSYVLRITERNILIKSYSMIKR